MAWNCEHSLGWRVKPALITFFNEEFYVLYLGFYYLSVDHLDTLMACLAVMYVCLSVPLLFQWLVSCLNVGTIMQKGMDSFSVDFQDTTNAMLGKIGNILGMLMFLITIWIHVCLFCEYMSVSNIIKSIWMDSWFFYNRSDFGKIDKTVVVLWNTIWI